MSVEDEMQGEVNSLREQLSEQAQDYDCLLVDLLTAIFSDKAEKYWPEAEPATPDSWREALAEILV